MVTSSVYYQGISGLGRGAVLNYILSRDRGRSVTEEIVGWSDQAQVIGDKYKQLEGIKRKPHCGICKHQGKECALLSKC